jgi:NAD(P)H-flavin reductase
LDDLAVQYPDRFHVWYTVSRHDKGWNHSVGHVDESMLAKHLPPSHPDNGILLCGPIGLKNKAAIPNLLKIGYNKDQILDF